MAKRRDAYAALIDAGLPESDALSLARDIADRLENRRDPGQPLSALEMTNMAVVLDEDIERARVDWYTNEAIPSQFKRLLDAKEVEE